MNGLIGKRLIVVSILVVILITILGFSIYGVANLTSQPEINNPTDKIEVDNSTDQTEVNNCTNNDNSTYDQIEFQTISKGYCSGHRSPAYYVILNEDEWTDVWNQHQSIFIPQLPTPEVNFSKTIVIAVFMGEFNTGGYGIEIKEILDMNQSVVVKVEKIHPGKGCGVILAFTQPYHIVKIDKIDKEITFDTVERTIECP